MFTGIIQAVGKVTRISEAATDRSIYFDCTSLADKVINIGDSIAVNGCCLTVVEREKNILKVDVSGETLNRTLMADYVKGSLLNLELAMLPDTRFGGHIVSGHIDCLAHITAKELDGRSTRFEFSMSECGQYIAQKGSVTIDGVSLTVNDVFDDAGQTHFGVNIIPHTLEMTRFTEYALGSRVHIEVDMIARYTQRLNQYYLHQSETK